MSNALDHTSFDVQQLLNEGKTHSLRQQMREFVSEHDDSADFKDVRSDASDGKPLSDVVLESREERL